MATKSFNFISGVTRRFIIFKNHIQNRETRQNTFIYRFKETVHSPWKGFLRFHNYKLGAHSAIFFFLKHIVQCDCVPFVFNNWFDLSRWRHSTLLIIGTDSHLIHMSFLHSYIAVMMLFQTTYINWYIHIYKCMLIWYSGSHEDTDFWFWVCLLPDRGLWAMARNQAQIFHSLQLDQSS